MEIIEEVRGYTGTGLVQVPVFHRWLKPVEDLLRPLDRAAEYYYRDLLSLTEHSELIPLPYAGWADPRLRHRDSNRRSDQKSAGRQLELTLWGHSQGGIEAVFQMLRSRLPEGVRIKAVFCLSAPLNGSPAADMARPLASIPRPLRQLFKGVLEMRPASRSQLHLHDKIRATVLREDFELPHIYLVGAQHDHLVPVRSAWHWPLEYPAAKVHRVLMVNGRVKVPAEVEHVLQVARHMDNHLRMVHTDELLGFMAEVMGAPHPRLKLINPTAA